MIGRVKDNHRMFRMRFLLHQWRRFVEDRKKYIKSLVMAVEKSIWQQAFSAIKERAASIGKLQRLDKGLTALVRAARACKTRGHFSQWKS